jgi:hypothetical protein
VASILWTYTMLKSGKKPERDFDAIIDECERCEAQGITERKLNATLPRIDWVPAGWLKKRKAEAVAARDRLRAQRQQHDGPPPQLSRVTTLPVHPVRKSASTSGADVAKHLHILPSMFRLIWRPWMRVGDRHSHTPRSAR